MAGTKKRKKKKPPVKRKAIVRPKKDVVEEMDGWKLGDLVWGLTQKNEHLYGMVATFHPANQICGNPPEELGPAVTLMTEPDKKYRAVLLSSLKEKGPTKATRSLARKKAKIEKDKK